MPLLQKLKALAAAGDTVALQKLARPQKMGSVPTVHTSKISASKPRISRPLRRRRPSSFSRHPRSFRPVNLVTHHLGRANYHQRMFRQHRRNLLNQYQQLSTNPVKALKRIRALHHHMQTHRELQQHHENQALWFAQKP